MVNPVPINIATATAEAIRRVAEASETQGGMTAVNLQVAEKYISAFNDLARTNNTLIVPANLGDMSTLISSAMKIINANQQEGVNAIGSTTAQAGATKASTAATSMSSLTK